MAAASVLGVTIDGYACEGGFDVEGGPATSFGVAQSLGRCRPSLRSPGTYEHLGDVVARAASLGVHEVRLTAEWARLEPRPGHRDDQALEHYAGVLEAACAAGLAAHVVLCDAAWPAWLGQEPWLSSWAPERFAEHAAWVGARLAGIAGTIVTFRAPQSMARLGWLEGRRPPFRRRARADAADALDGLLLAHQLAVAALEAAAPGARRGLIASAGPTGELTALVGAVAGMPVARPSPRAGPRWSTTPRFELWAASDDPAVLSSEVGRVGDSLGAVELGATGRGWRLQLDTAMSVLCDRLAGATPLHLHGALGSTGPVDGLLGLFDVDQHAGRWQLVGPRPDVAASLARALGRS